MENSNGINGNIRYIPACGATGFLLNTDNILIAEHMKKFLEENQKNYIYFDNNTSLKTNKINSYTLLSKEEIFNNKDIFYNILKLDSTYKARTDIREYMILCYCEKIYLEHNN